MILDPAIHTAASNPCRFMDARVKPGHDELENWRRDWKIRLIEEANPDWDDLYPSIT